MAIFLIFAALSNSGIKKKFICTLNLTEENKKPEPCRLHSTMSFKIKYQHQCPEIWIIPKEIKLYQKMMPKNLEAPRKGTQNNDTSSYQSMYASYPLTFSSIAWMTINSCCLHSCSVTESDIKFSKMPTSKRYNNWSWSSSMIQ